jgi:hypothetical protein
LDNKLEDKRFCTEQQQVFPDFNLPLISSWIEFWFVKVFPEYLTSATLSKALLSIFIYIYIYEVLPGYLLFVPTLVYFQKEKFKKK